MANEQPSLQFDNLDQVVDYCQNLLENGYTATGQWNLSQVCGHLRNWMSYPMDGFPAAPFLMRPMLWMMKVTKGRSMLKKILADGFQPGGPTNPASIPGPSDADEAEASVELAKTIDRFQAHNGAFNPSPFFGDMDRQRLTQLQLRHCEHHLSFLKPKAAA